MCAQYESCIGPPWPIPLCHGCNCRQSAIPVGATSRPFVDFLEEIRSLSLDQKHAVMGKGKWEIFAAGLVMWSDVVTPSRVREFHEVMDIKRLTIDQMVGAGVPVADVIAAWNLVHTPEREAVEARRKELLTKLMAHGLSKEEITRQIAADLAARIIGPKPMH
jgi:hypothetical protein